MGFMSLAPGKTFLLFIMLGATLQVRADVMVNNLNQPKENYFGPIGGDANTNDFLIAQEFTQPAGPNPFQLKEITLPADQIINLDL
jgi:hypothetical protein